MTIADNLKKIKKEIPQDVTLVAISKTKTNEEILEAYEAGQRIFGENRVQELEVKHQELPKDIEWHMVGHVQRNKVKDMAAFVSLIHAVDSLRLLNRIDREAKNNNKVIDCLLQVKIAEEETKHGMDENELRELLQSKEFKSLENVRIKGLMGMATFTDDEGQISREFETLKKIYDSLKEDYDFTILSMGMSGDFPIALNHGSNMIRVGSAIFGERE